ncbi:DUF5700 domain-containing putative Zn-dependent protease [Terriglobus roseus]|uniref:Uncharacterized protein n=1 Tax=Terriglobus roseus TaxID=392734 RepID=A0A1H4J456_9BACT|nr:DUF5700 domain-containing putative Zn-dependent protease [Terriglobus roseus]SEB40322.1 hypothetical protein SAMN05443244_0300 [Terriglobus roseus]
MKRSAMKIMAIVVFALMMGNAKAVVVAMNADSATAVLTALENPALSREECLRIAAMPGNQGVIRKSREFGFDTNTQNFADALYASARGIAPKDSLARSYYFDIVKQKTPQIRALIRQINANPDNFQGAIQKRLAPFTPQGTDLPLQGYIVAAGDGGGYAFGGTDFYLNLGNMNDFLSARVTTAHELYHAIQGVFATSRGSFGDLPLLEGLSKTTQACLKTKQLFSNLYEEGSAVYVQGSGPSELDNGTSEIANRQKADLEDGIRYARANASLLEMSVISLNAPEAMPYDDVYRVDFFGHGFLYSTAYLMAKAIVDQDGPGGLSALLELPPEQFILRYTQLRAYGKGNDHPKLGSNTIQAARSLPKVCPR